MEGEPVTTGFLDRIPAWLRWMLFLPAAIIALSAVYPLVIIAAEISDQSGFAGTRLGRMMFVAFASAYSAYAFVWVGAKVAPRERLLVSIVLTLVYGVTAGFVLAAHLMMGSGAEVTGFEVACVLLVGGGTAIGACYSFYREEKRSYPGLCGETAKPNSDFVGMDNSTQVHCGGGGLAVDDAVVIRAQSSAIGIPAEYEYVSNLHGQRGEDWELEMQEVMGKEGRYYDVLHIKTSAGERRSYYFDISGFFGNL
jgi:hypothetical protein